MTDPRRLGQRTAKSPEEREAWSHLRTLVHQDAGVLRGTLAVRQVVCGKSGCHCAQGERHTAHVLVASYDGRPRQLYVPAAMESIVRQWIARHHEWRDAIETLSRLHWDRVKRREV